ncbi:MAG: MMPL family transporter [Coriobacteriales bacterium]|jgi:predicted RND superfamily exporter protein
MLKFCERFLKCRVAVVVLFLVAAVVGGVAMSKVYVDYNIIDYLPDEAVSVKALHEMEDTFDSGVPNGRLYAEGVSLAQAKQIATDLGKIDGITDVMWLGTEADIDEPSEVLDADLVDNWKSDDGYLYQFVIDENSAADACQAARAVAAQDGASTVSLGGSAVDIADAQTSTFVEVTYILIAAVIIVIVILGLTSTSWLEPILFLVVIGVAILLNMGTNLIMGQISFISYICGAILQLAVSMDYAIVMLHTFRRQQRVYADPVEAMAHAMMKGFSVILSSAAVTFFGFLSLAVMHFQIGLDMGIVLSKGIVFSFLSVMFFMPCLLLCSLKLLDKTSHRNLVPPFDKFARFCQKGMVPMAIIVILATPICYIAQQHNSWEYGASNFAAPGSETRIEADRIDEAFGYNETWVVMVPEGHWADEQALINDLKSLDMVSGVTSYITVAGTATPVDVAPESTRSQVINKGVSRLVISTEITGENQEAFNLVETVRGLCEKYYGDDYGLVGTQVSVYDLRDIVTADSARVKIFSAAAIAIVLMLMFRSISIPIITVACIEIAIIINMSCAYFTGTTIAYIGYLVIDAVQMGASVDYAIIFEREYFDRRKIYLPREAARSATKHSAITIMTSALILTCAGFAVSKISSNQIIAGIGVLIGRGAFISMLMMFMFLPGLLVAFDWVIRHTTIKMQYLRKGETPPDPQSVGISPEEPRLPSKRQQRKAAEKAAQANATAQTQGGAGTTDAQQQAGSQPAQPAGADERQTGEAPSQGDASGKDER